MPTPDDDRPWEQPRDREPDDYDDRPRRRRRLPDDRIDDTSNGLATISLVLGIISLCTGPLFGLPAVICAAIAMGKSKSGAAKAGLVTGILGTTVVPIVLIALLLPAVQKVREAAARMTDQNNMRQMSLAMLNFHDTYRGVAAPYAYGNRGINTDMSFRVTLLPFMEQQSLALQFDTTVPWDSPKNRSASSTIVKTFTTPIDVDPSSGETHYRVFYGGGAMFQEDGRLVSFNSVTDGTSNTIMLIHSTERVPWASPQEIKYSPTGSLPPLTIAGARGTNVGFGDGMVRFIKQDSLDQNIRAAITATGGERLPPEW
ncbi:MAG: DUF1559 domain-containing protein [Planctomycetes bacterium]|nr:DUF1559 domain-containing protein [Planctomycetota bacterium]